MKKLLGCIGLKVEMGCTTLAGHKESPGNLITLTEKISQYDLTPGADPTDG